MTVPTEKLDALMAAVDQYTESMLMDSDRDLVRTAALDLAIAEHEAHGCGVGHLAPCSRLAELRAMRGGANG